MVSGLFIGILFGGLLQSGQFCFVSGLLIYQHYNPRYTPPSQGRFNYLPLNITGVLIGILGIIAWVFSAEAGRNFGYGVAVPSGNVIQYLITGHEPGRIP